jgi:hypothetical protein
MKYFFDCEFLEDGRTIDLISIGVVCEDGREYLAINKFADFNRILDESWLVENVLPHLGFNKPADESWVDFYYPGRMYPEMNERSELFKNPDQIKNDLIEFITGDNIEFWAYYGDYDWVCLCRLFGQMIDLPEGWPKLCYDLRQWLNHKGLDYIRQPDDAPHHALLDARWGAGTYSVWANWSPGSPKPESVEPGVG